MTNTNRFMSWNVHGTFNLNRKFDLAGICALIGKWSPDVVALQEVDKGTLRSNGLDQAEALAELTGLPHHAHFRAATLFGGDYGVAVISRFPILQTRRVRLPTFRGEETRALARAVIDVEGVEVSVYVTHLSHMPHRSDLRAEQAQAILRRVERDPRPAILMGDLNDAPSSTALLLLRQRFSCAFNRAGEGEGSTFPLPFPLADLRLDYVMASDAFVARRAYVLREVASDHFPVVADLQLVPGDGAVATLSP